MVREWLQNLALPTPRTEQVALLRACHPLLCALNAAPVDARQHLPDSWLQYLMSPVHSKAPVAHATLQLFSDRVFFSLVDCPFGGREVRPPAARRMPGANALEQLQIMILGQCHDAQGGV